MKNDRSTYFTCIFHIPHFYIIRSVESKLLKVLSKQIEVLFLILAVEMEVSARLWPRGTLWIDFDVKAVYKAIETSCYKMVLLSNARQLPFSDAFFGTVFSNCALEHMDELAQVLAGIRRVLKPGGNLIFIVPSENFLDVVKNDPITNRVALNNDFTLSDYNKFHHHINIFDRIQWKGILESMGFKLLVCKSYLPGVIGRLVAHMDFLHTINARRQNGTLQGMEEDYWSFRKLPFRLCFKGYLRKPTWVSGGTHLIIRRRR